MSWENHLFLKEDSTDSVVQIINVRNSDGFIIQLVSMESCFSLKLLVHGTGLVSLKLRHWLNLDQIFYKKK